MQTLLVSPLCRRTSKGVLGNVAAAVVRDMYLADFAALSFCLFFFLLNYILRGT